MLTKKLLSGLALSALTLPMACELDPTTVFPDELAPIETNFLDVDDPASTSHPLTVPPADLSVALGAGLSVAFGAAAERMIDGNNTFGSGWHSNVDEETGQIVFTLSKLYNLSEVRIFNDYGSNAGQGIQNYSVTYRGSGGALIATANLVTTEANQLVTPELVSLSGTAVKTIEIDVVDNWTATSGTITNSLNVAEVEFEGVETPVATDCAAGSIIQSVSVGGGLSERDPILWPATDLCDLNTTSQDGYASDVDEDAGTITVTFSGPQTINSFEIWQDFGTNAGQGADEISIAFTGGATVGPFAGTAAIQLDPNLSDYYSFATQTGVTGAVITIGDNLIADATTGLQNSLNLREIAFGFQNSDTRPCTSALGQIAGVALQPAGFTERDMVRWPIQDICDGSINAADGFASRSLEEAGGIHIEFVSGASFNEMRLWNDFGVNIGQGAMSGTIEFFDAMSASIGSESWTTNAANQGNAATNVDTIGFSTTYSTATTATLTIADVHYVGAVDLYHSLNLREIRFTTAVPD